MSQPASVPGGAPSEWVSPGRAPLSPGVPGPRHPRSWPVYLIALPAAVAIWGGWVGLGEMIGFGTVQLLPGLWDSARINIAITLPIGMEAYAAYALYVWLCAATTVTQKARQFAMISAFAALAVGASGQVAYHLLVALGYRVAPWPIVAMVSLLPVAVLGMAAGLAHLLRERVGTSQGPPPERPSVVPPERPSVAPSEVPRVAPATAPRAVPPAAPRLAPWSPAVSSTSPAGPGPERPNQAPVRPGPATVGPERSGPERSDEELARQIRAMATRDGSAPSIYAVKRELSIGSTRATRLLGEFADAVTKSPGRAIA